MDNNKIKGLSLFENIEEKKHTRKIEGYWKVNHEFASPQEKMYPMPIPNVLSQEEASEIHDLILKKQEEAKELFYRGCSGFRITGERLEEIRNALNKNH